MFASASRRKRQRFRPVLFDPQTGITVYGCDVCICVRLEQAQVIRHFDVRRVAMGLDKAITSVGRSKVALDFEAVTTISSEMIGKIIELNQVLKARGGELALVRLAEPIREVMSLTGMDRIVPVLDTIEDAVAHFDQSQKLKSRHWLTALLRRRR